MAKDAYCSYEVSKLLKEKGFDEICYRIYNTQEKELWGTDGIEFQNHQIDEESIAAPSHQLAMAWLREKGIHICPRHRCFCGVNPKDTPYYRWQTAIFRLPGNRLVYPLPIDMAESYDSYEEAVEAGLKYVLVDFEKLLGL